MAIHLRLGPADIVSTRFAISPLWEVGNAVRLLTRPALSGYHAPWLESVQPDIVMTDISMPGMDGITAIAQIHDRYPELKVLVLSMYDTVDFVRRAVANGACGYLMKDAPPFELEHALRSVMAVGSFYSPVIAQKLMQPAELTAEDELTARQVEILVRIAQGESAKEIAYALGLSPKTVDVHRARIMERLQLNDIASLTRYAIRKGLLKA